MFLIFEKIVDNNRIYDRLMKSKAQESFFTEGMSKVQYIKTKYYIYYKFCNKSQLNGNLVGSEVPLFTIVV